MFPAHRLGTDHAKIANALTGPDWYRYVGFSSAICQSSSQDTCRCHALTGTSAREFLTESFQRNRIVSMETDSTSDRRVPELETHVGYWLRCVSNAVSGDFARALQEEQTSVAEWVLLRELHDRGRAAPGELAEFLGLTRGAVSKIIDKLEAKDWVQMNAKEGDSRYRLLSITRAGRRSLPVLAQIADRNDSAYFDCLSARRRLFFANCLSGLPSTTASTVFQSNDVQPKKETSDGSHHR